jgi:uncharacterized protein YegL
MDQIEFGTDNFAENPEPRVPCVLLLDISDSMSGKPINELQDGIAAYREQLLADSLAAKRVEVAVVTFGTKVETVCPFSTASSFTPPVLETSGLTSMGGAMSLAIDLIEERKNEYKTNGVAYYRPWIFLISDGAPNDEGWQQVAARAVTLEKNKQFKTFCVGVEGANLEALSMFSEAEPLMLKGLRFNDMFMWLSSSQKSVSRSSPGDEVPLSNPTGPDGWGSVG